jgi:ferredoxin
MQEYLQQIEDEFENIHIHTCYSQLGDEDIMGEDFNSTGHVNVELLKTHLPGNNFEFYFCGPPAMVDSFKGDLAKWGVPVQNQHYEQFEKPEIKKKSETIESEIVTATIKLSKSDKSFAWSDSSDSILDLALSNGANIDYSCRRGMCGLCQTAIKSGEVYYDEEPEYLSDLEQGMCLPCVAKTKKGLELYA